MAELATRATAMVEAFNSSDWDAVRELFGDSTYKEIGTQRSIAGATRSWRRLQGWKSAMPDAKHRNERDRERSAGRARGAMGRHSERRDAD